jgi:hypothetical protein
MSDSAMQFLLAQAVAAYILDPTERSRTYLGSAKDDMSISKVMPLCLLLYMPTFAQQGHEQILPPGSIDGRTNPELIPDIVAFRLVFAAIAEPREAISAAPSPIPTDKQKAKLAAAGLGTADESALVDALAGFKEDVGRIVSGKATSKETLDDAAQRTLDRVRARMSPDGFERLVAYVQSKKKLMKRIPLPDMATHSH